MWGKERNKYPRNNHTVLDTEMSAQKKSRPHTQRESWGEKKRKGNKGGSGKHQTVGKNKVLSLDREKSNEPEPTIRLVQKRKEGWERGNAEQGGLKIGSDKKPLGGQRCNQAPRKGGRQEGDPSRASIDGTGGFSVFGGEEL